MSGPADPVYAPDLRETGEGTMLGPVADVCPSDNGDNGDLFADTASKEE